MNKRSRKTKGLSRKLIAWLICCVCLIGAMPISAIALETNAAPVEEEIVTEKPTAVSLGTDISLAAIGGEDSITLKIKESATVTSYVTGTSANYFHQEPHYKPLGH